jgi:hypothetical protein
VRDHEQERIRGIRGVRGFSGLHGVGGMMHYGAKMKDILAGGG